MRGWSAYISTLLILLKLFINQLRVCRVWLQMPYFNAWHAWRVWLYFNIAAFCYYQNITTSTSTIIYQYCINIVNCNFNFISTTTSTFLPLWKFLQIKLGINWCLILVKVHILAFTNAFNDVGINPFMILLHHHWYLSFKQVYSPT